MRVVTKSPAETKRLARNLAQRLKGQETIALIGELGAGKTTFIQGLAAGLGIKRQVISPTFILQRIYRGRQHTLFHYDFYRLAPAEIADLDLNETLGRGIVVIEWADKMRALPQGYKIEIQDLGRDKRSFKISRR